jgi:hypothetical protein
MTALYKYVLSSSGLTTVAMPPGARVVAAQAQVTDDPAGWTDIVVWAEVDPTAPSTETRAFRVFGTGHGFDAENLTYIDTVQIGSYVYHVYEQAAPPLD